MSADADKTKRKAGEVDTGEAAGALLREAGAAVRKGGVHYETMLGRAYLVLLARLKAERAKPVQQSLFVRPIAKVDGGGGAMTMPSRDHRLMFMGSGAPLVLVVPIWPDRGEASAPASAST